MRVWEPRAGQRDIVNHQFAHARGATLAGMGTGKTVSTLSAIDGLQMTGEGPALVLAPKRVAVSTWPDEARKWTHTAHMDVVPIVGSAAERAAALKRTAAVYTTNYENLPWLVETLGRKWPFRIVVADESTRLKSFRLKQGGRRTRALSRVAHPLVRRWINLTGTPAPNGLLDLWGQTWFLDRGQRLGHSYTAFRDRWFCPDHDGYSWKLRDGAADEIHAALSDICLTVDGPPVDEPVRVDVRVDLPAKARSLYADMARTYFAVLSSATEIEAATAAVKSTKLLQMANGAVYDEQGVWHEVHDVKLQALDSIVHEISGANLLVAYHWRHDLERLQRAFPHARVLDDDPQTIRDWNAGRIRMLLAHPQSAGHGLNLQDGGHHLAFFGVTWNLEHHDQIVERLGPRRQQQAGYDRPVYIYYILANHTLDEQVVERYTSKASIQAALLEALRA